MNTLNRLFEIAKNLGYNYFEGNLRNGDILFSTLPNGMGNFISISKSGAYINLSTNNKHFTNITKEECYNILENNLFI